MISSIRLTGEQNGAAESGEPGSGLDTIESER